MNRIHGHGLVSEGAAYDTDKHRANWNSTSGTGRAWCQCGAMSDVLDTSTKRKAWHREHKQRVLDGTA